MQPAILFELLPAFGFLLCTTSLSYLWLMRAKKSDFFAIIYAFQALDALLAFSLFYAGFHGSAVIANTEESTMVRPASCIFAIHISAWCILDTASAAILLILCFDQIISIIWTKTHKSICKFYMHPCLILLIFALSFGMLQPAWSYALGNSENSTITTTPFCSMSAVFDEEFYDLELAIRMLTPLIGLILLFLAALILLCYQLSQDWQFKWSDSNAESVRCYYFAVVRTTLAAISIHLPVWLFFKPKLESSDEVCLRMFQAGVLGIIQPLFLLKLFPEYWIETKNFFLRYSHNTKRNWQSADDPPADHTNSSGDVGLDFGSWYSSGGNIIGECGIPYELNADKQRSISFYYNEMERY